jgi:hypothetical protein
MQVLLKERESLATLSLMTDLSNSNQEHCPKLQLQLDGAFEPEGEYLLDEKIDLGCSPGKVE